MNNDFITSVDAPPIPGLRFRHFRGEIDYPLMVEVISLSNGADQIESVATVEDLAFSYSRLNNCDPYQDMIIAEIEHQMIGYCRGWWRAEQDQGPYTYGFNNILVPNWRSEAIRWALVQWIESRLRRIAEAHPMNRIKLLQTSSAHGASGLADFLKKHDYAPVRFGQEMIRPDLDDIPNFPLPDGIQIRPVLPEHYRLIWEASNEAFIDHWGFSQPTEKDYDYWLNDKITFQPDLWQIAWDIKTDQIAGQVRTFIYHAQNVKFNRQRGDTEFISVRRPWRKRGLARALICQSLRTQKAQGMTESMLGVDSENLSGATRVYRDCGFRVFRTNTLFRKPM
jgi:GNAT superfamily N-acetyltransferase